MTILNITNKEQHAKDVQNLDTKDAVIKNLAYAVSNGKRALWAWRGLVVILLLGFIVITMITYSIDRDQHAYDNRVRAENWGKMENGISANKELLLKIENEMYGLPEQARQRAIISLDQYLRDSSDRERLMILKNYDAILKVDAGLRECSSCHSHPKVISKP
jgi:hypothetical protein